MMSGELSDNEYLPENELDEMFDFCMVTFQSQSSKLNLLVKRNIFF